jgi:hypothetical protein
MKWPRFIEKALNISSICLSIGKPRLDLTHDRLTTQLSSMAPPSNLNPIASLKHSPVDSHSITEKSAMSTSTAG